MNSPSARQNAFGLMRLLLAGLVIVSHAFPLGGFGVDPTGYWTHSQANIGFLAVLALFALSGYLITGSMRRTRVRTYLWHRGLRILPAFWVVLLFGAVVIGPLAWTIERGSVAGYWSLVEGGPVTYVLRNFSTYIGQFGIHDIFLETPYGQLAHRSAINGSTWSLYFEMRMYLAVAVLGWLKVLERARWLVPIGAIAAIAATQLVDRVPVLVPVIHGLFGPGWGPRLAAIFLLGASAALYSENLILNARLAGLAAIVVVVTLAVGGFHVLGCVGYAYLILFLCLRAPRWSRRVARNNDISFGLYLYAFPVQLLLTVLGVPKLGLLPYIAMTVLLTVPLAIASWLLIEKPALRLKSRGPGRSQTRGTNSAGPAHDLVDYRLGVPAAGGDLPLIHHSPLGGDDEQVGEVDCGADMIGDHPNH